ncbi:MAG: YggS family pyridoxal phosphate-dependent enzyme [Clostridia bacterium]|nr:YggS family pyridoxal phosphate-dependent enzyme [Clostridia bacterium]
MPTMTEEYAYIERNLRNVRARLAAAAARAGRPVPRLIAVTKSADDGEVRALLGLGIDAIAENRPQLFSARAALIDEADTDTEIHLIGHLQTNKAKTVVGRAALIQSLDSERLAAELQKQAERHGLTVPVLIEVNSGREEAKGGLLPEEVDAFAAALRAYPAITPLGLMTMGPDCEDPEDYRPYFRLVREAAERLSAAGLLPPSPLLSMGMSTSYEVAAEEGATHVRVGRTLFRKDE